MPMSLINPNQIRNVGYIASNNLIDNNGAFGITDYDFEIPFATHGTAIFFTKRTPTTWEMESYNVRFKSMDSA